MLIELEKGKWAVACTGTRQWGGDASLGDGITLAHNALVTRTVTKAAAEEIVRRFKAAQPLLMPGSGNVRTYEVLRYEIKDYLSWQQVNQNQCRNVDRRIAKVD